MSKYIGGTLPFVNHTKNLVRSRSYVFNYFLKKFNLDFICDTFLQTIYFAIVRIELRFLKGPIVTILNYKEKL
jgi:hypothetical protein